MKPIVTSVDGAVEFDWIGPDDPQPLRAAAERGCDRPWSRKAMLDRMLDHGTLRVGSRGVLIVDDPEMVDAGEVDLTWWIERLPGRAP